MTRWAAHPAPGAPPDVALLRVDLDLAAPLDGAPFDVLSPDERAAAARFHRHADAVRSAAARAALRHALGAALGRDPAGLRFARDARGRPSLEGGGPDFNLSHGGGHALVAWSAARRVGVDVEPRRPGADWAAMARLVLGAGDARHLGAAAEAARPALFLDCWTAKEALLKADGRGLGGEMASFSVLGGDRPAASGEGALAAALARFDACWIGGLPGHAAALAWGRDGGEA